MLFRLACASIGRDSGLTTVVVNCYELTMLPAVISRNVVSQTVLALLRESGHNKENNVLTV